ncbi:MAG: aminotransferase class V-fold PLP-dependent enzyme [Clostridia bacterium]|nr:aminotransferase class V-fold PLP-dependent enzyme [Clostridia bacterium]
MIYLDNAATSFPKPEKVYEEIARCMREYCANPGRSGHAMSIEAGRAVMQARDTISSLFNISNPLQLVFTKNATEALNIAIKGGLKPGDHAITTGMEHNSVIRPLKTLERDFGVELSIVRGNDFGEIQPEDIGRCIRPNTKLIAATLSSNVNGIILPVKEIGAIARDKGITFLVDGSQGAGSVTIDVEDMNIDMLAFPGHKGLLGPQGTGGLYVREGVHINCLMQGGTGSSSESVLQPEFMPDYMESGTLNTPGIVGLGFGASFIKSFGIENIKHYKSELIKRLHEGIVDIKEAKLYSKSDINKNSGIVALCFKNMDSNEISSLLDRKYHIATRAGLHCAPLAHKSLGTLKCGLVRLSVGCFNTVEEIDFTISALNEISREVQKN